MIQAKGTLSSMSSTNQSQVANFNSYWQPHGSDDNSGYNLSATNNSAVNSTTASCSQASLDYYPYGVGFYNQAYTPTNAALYPLAAHIPPTSTNVNQLLCNNWEPEEADGKSKTSSSKKHCAHYVSEANSFHHPLDNGVSTTPKSIELITSHSNFSSKKGQNLNSLSNTLTSSLTMDWSGVQVDRVRNYAGYRTLSSMNSTNQSQIANFNCYWPSHGSEDNSGFNLSATNNSTVNSSSATTELQRAQTSLDYAYPYGQANQCYAYPYGVGFYNQAYTPTNAALYQLAAHIPPTSTNVNQLLCNNWEPEEADGKSKTSSSKKHCAHYVSEANSFHHPLDNGVSTTPKPPIELITSHTNSSSKKSTTRSGRGRGRRQQTQSPDPENPLERAFIWDLDETIIIYEQLLQGKFASKTANEDTLRSLGLMIESMCMMEGELHFFLNDLENCDQIHVDDVSSDDNGQDLSNYDFSADGFNQATKNCNMGLPAAGSRNGVDWMRKLAFRYRRIKELYNQYRNNVAALLGSKYQNWKELRGRIESCTNNWLSCAILCLDIIHRRPNCVNILVTETGLVPSLVKVLLHDLGPYFPIENIYSASKVGKDLCFSKIKERFGSKCTYVVIGDGQQEEMASKSLGMPFWKVENHAALVNLHSALQQDIL